ncbi:MAG: CoA-transferase [Ktedonobacteraceae bacterium]|nr:CoA-transferase [Ktedonobacteraceae bacterium]
MNYTPRELMVVCAARQIRDGEHVFVGMRLPLLAFALAKHTHAPESIGIFEAGIIRDTPSAELLYTMGDPPNIVDALWATSTRNVIGLMAQGEIHLGFIGGAEIDRYGNLNTSMIGDWQQPRVRLPGSGGGADIASLAGRLAIIMPHEKHRLRERVDYVTSPGYGYPGEQGPAGTAWRQRVGLPRGGPVALITTLAVFTFDPASGEALLQSYHPGATIEQVQEQTGWPLRLAPDCAETIPPNKEELFLIRQCDPQGVWTR